MRYKDDNYEKWYTKEEVIDCILAVLEGHPAGMYESYLINELPDEISENVAKTFLVQMCKEGLLVYKSQQYRLADNVHYVPHY